MSEPIILSDEEDHQNPLSSPLQPLHSKKRRTEFDPNPNPTVLILDDDPTPHKPGPTSTTYFVPDTPNSDIAIVKCTRAAQHKLSGINGLICLESDNEPGSGCGGENNKENESMHGGFGLAKVLDWSPTFVESPCSPGHSDLANRLDGRSSNPTSLQDDIDQVLDYPDDENKMDQMSNIMRPRKESIAITEKETITKEVKGRKKMTKEERTRLMEEKKLKKLEEKLQKEALKAEAAEMKKIQKEKQRWEKGKFALKSIVAEIDSKVVESGSVGGNLLTRLAERGLTYRITSNPIERSIVWTMTVPEHISQLSLGGTEIQYILLVYEAEEFCKLIINESLQGHVIRVQNHYPSYTVCYLTNKLITYVRKREGELYNGRARLTVDSVEKVLAKLTTNFSKVHSRQCKDEAELAEHVVGLTCSLSSCLFRKKLTRLDVNANGSFITKDCIDRHLIKKSSWLKALVAIPKVQPRFAIAIGKKYPTMKSLLSVYMDPNISVHEKEFLLKDLTTEGLLGGDRRLGEVCSKRVYRILMAQSGCTKTDDVEDGADFFRNWVNFFSLHNLCTRVEWWLSQVGQERSCKGNSWEAVPINCIDLSSGGTEIKYIVLVYEAQDFCKLIKESLFKHVLRVQRRYPSYTICYLTNRLLAYVSKSDEIMLHHIDVFNRCVRDEELFKNPTNHNGWTRPPVEKLLAELTTNFVRVHSRQCKDEAELAEHVVGLTCSLSSCQFRLKALVAMPKVQPRFAIAIGKKYPTMKSLLSVYMDPNISVHEKEFLLKDLTTEGLLGGDRRLGEVCSKRVYRILMAQSGCIKTDDVEDGADIFRHQWTELP